METPVIPLGSPFHRSGIPSAAATARSGSPWGRSPSETAVLEVLDLRVDLSIFSTQGGEHGIEVLHSVVDHEGRAILPEVRGLGGEQGPVRVAFLPGVPPAPPFVRGHRALDSDTELVAIPASERLRVLRLEEDATDPRHAGTTRSCGHARESRDLDKSFPKSFPPPRIPGSARP